MSSEHRGASSPATTYNLLFVCTGNTCRSPLAEALARDHLGRRGWSHVDVASAGTHAEPGAPAARHSLAVGIRRGLDLGAHRSQPLTPELVEWADLILVMGSGHLAPVRRMGGKQKVAMLGDFAAGGDEEGGRSVPDPFGGDEETYARTLAVLDEMLDAALERLAPVLAP